MTSISSLPRLIEELADRYGSAPDPFPTDAFELVLWENVAYLADDGRRRRALDSLRRTIGTRPEQILGATRDGVVEVASHGILAEQSASKLRSAAEIALGEFDGDLDDLVSRPVAQACPFPERATAESTRYG